jgi:hypothetical protein
MRRIALLAIVSCLLVAACSQDPGHSAASSESRAAASASLDDVRRQITRELRDMQVELRPLLISDGSRARLLPFASAGESQRVERTAKQWQASLEAIPANALSGQGQHELQELKAVAEGLARPLRVEHQDIRRLIGLAALNIALWRIEASRDVVDPSVASERWEERMRSVGEQILLRQAQSVTTDWSSIGCDFGRAIALGVVANDVDNADRSDIDNIAVRLRANASGGPECPDAPMEGAPDREPRLALASGED